MGKQIFTQGTSVQSTDHLRELISGLLNTNVSVHKKGSTVSIEVPTCKLIGISSLPTFQQPDRRKFRSLTCDGLTIIKDGKTTKVSGKDLSSIYNFIGSAASFERSKTLDLTTV